MNRDPAACTTMSELRAIIDALDEDIVALLAKRAACIDRAVEIKRQAGLPARIDDRVEQVALNARDRAARAGLDPAFVEGLWRQLIEWSIAREERALGASEERPEGRSDEC